MKYIQSFLRVYYSVLTAISPRMAGNRAFLLFCTTFARRKRFRKRELEFYHSVSHFKTASSFEDIHCYELGKPENPLLLLVHGWNSNAGSMHSIATRMEQLGYYVVLLDLPAHGMSDLKRAHLVLCSEALRTVVHRLLPDRPFSVISHSFGSAVVAYALSESRFHIDRWAMLTSPNQMSDVFQEFRDFISLPRKANEVVLRKAEAILGEPVEQVSVQDRIQRLNVEKLMMLHDRHDRILSFDYSAAIQAANPKSSLVELDRVGHYRMLSNEKVLDHLDQFLNRFVSDVRQEEQFELVS